MNIIKAVRILHNFIVLNENEEIGKDGENFERLFIRYTKQHHYRAQSVSFYLHLAIVKGFIIFDNQANKIGEAFEISTAFTDHVIKNDTQRKKFLYGLIGSVFTIVGGIIGALIAALT